MMTNCVLMILKITTATTRLDSSINVLGLCLFGCNELRTKGELNEIRSIFFSLTMTLTNENIHAKYLNSQQTNKPVNERRKNNLNSVANFDMENTIGKIAPKQVDC